MRFNPKARLDTSRVRDVGGSGGGGGGGGGGMRIPIPGGTKAGGGIGGVLIVILFLVLTQCIGGGTGGLPDNGLDTCRMAGRHRPLRQLQDRRGRQRERGLRAGRGRELLADYWSRALPEQAGTEFQPEADSRPSPAAPAPAAATPPPRSGRSTARVDDTIYLDTTFFERGAPAAARRPGRRLRRALRAGPRVRPPHPEPARHHGPGPDPAGTQQRLGPPRAPGRLLRRHVGQERHDAPTTPTASRCIARPHRRGHPAGDRRRPRPSATTGSSSRPRVGSTRSSGPTARPRPRVQWFQTGFSEGTLQACDTFAPATVE